MTEDEKWLAERIQQEIECLRVDYGHSTGASAFAHWAVRLLHGLTVEDAFDRVVMHGGSRHSGVDGSYYDEVDFTFHLHGAKFADVPTDVDAQVVSDLFDALELLENPAEADGVGPAVGRIARELAGAVEDGAAIQLDFLLLGDLNEAARKELAARQAAATAQHGDMISVQVVGLRRLAELYLATGTKGLEGKVIDFALADAAVIDCKFDSSRAIVANLDAAHLGQLVEKHSPLIFNSNVRQFLRRKSRINKGIRKTLCNEEPEEYGTRDFFWHYNNGITILCDDLVIDHRGGLAKLTNPQIVNGCQTASTLAELHAQLGAGRVSVLARIIKLPSDDQETHALRIAKYTNSQNPVQEPDLRSNDGVQKKIQLAFSKMTPAVYYQRKRGGWEALGKTEQKKYASMVEMVKLGQCWLAFDGSPAQAITSKSKLFDPGEKDYKRVYDPKRAPAEFLLAFKLFDWFRPLAHSLAVSFPGDDETAKEAESAPNLVAAHLCALAKVMFEHRYGALSVAACDSLLVTLEGEKARLALFVDLAAPLLTAMRHRHLPQTAQQWLKKDDAFRTAKLELMSQKLAPARHRPELLSYLPD